MSVWVAAVKMVSAQSSLLWEIPPSRPPWPQGGGGVANNHGSDKLEIFFKKLEELRDCKSKINGGWSLVKFMTLWHCVIVELQVNLLWREAMSVYGYSHLPTDVDLWVLCFLFLLQEVKERDPELIKFGVRYCHGILWVQSTCSVILEPACFVEDFLVSVSFDDVLITIDKTELVWRGSFDVLGGGCPCASEWPCLPSLMLRQQVVSLSLFLSFAGRGAAPCGKSV